MMMNKFLYIILFLLLGSFLKTSLSVTYSCLSNAACGCSANSAVLTKIVGGELAAPQTWGWAASLRSKPTDKHFCGGSIISRSHILTAAHCVDQINSPSSIRIYVGAIDLSSTAQRTDVSKIIIHPSYSSITYLNDIAILKLSSSLNLDQIGVDLVCLPNVSSTILAISEYPTPNINLVAIGWGVQSEGSQTVSPTLRQVTIQSIASTNSYCQNVAIGDSSKRFCAGVMPEGGKDTCQGDSGGPLLMFTSKNVWEQVGITSVGRGCARPFYPGIYTRVAAYQTWINATISSANQLFNLSILLLNLFVFLFILI